MAATDGFSANSRWNGATRVEQVTPSANDLTFKPICVMVDADATVTMTIGGTSAALPLKSGVQYFLRPDKITAVSTGNAFILD